MAQNDATKSVLRAFTYGLYVAASPAADGPRAATVSWVTQVSFEPRMIAVAMRKGTAIHEAVQESGVFSLSVVGANQADFARAFFRANRPEDGQIGGFSFTIGEMGVPVFDAAAAWITCEVVEMAGQKGDHTVFIAQILDSGMSEAWVSALALRDTPWHYGG